MRMLLLVTGGLVFAQSGARPLDDSQPPELTSDQGRGALRRRMSRHGAMLDDLALATLRLDRARVAGLAAGLERDTGLGAWSGPDGGVAGRTSVGRLESQLRVRSRALADAAWGGPEDALPLAFGRLMETCVQCHVEALAPAAAKSSPR